MKTAKHLRAYGLGAEAVEDLSVAVEQAVELTRLFRVRFLRKRRSFQKASVKS